PPAVLVDLIDERGDILVGLCPERRGDHPASTLTREVVQRDLGLVALPDGERANIMHGVPSCRCLPPASVLINREGTPPSSSSPSTTFGYSSRSCAARADARADAHSATAPARHRTRPPPP